MLIIALLKRFISYIRTHKKLVGGLFCFVLIIALMLMSVLLAFDRVKIQEERIRQYEQSIVNILHSIDEFYNDFTVLSGNRSQKLAIYRQFLVYQAEYEDSDFDHDEITESFNSVIDKMTNEYLNEYDIIISAVEAAASDVIFELNGYVDEYLLKSDELYETFNSSSSIGIVLDVLQEPVERERVSIFVQLAEIQDIFLSSETISNNLEAIRLYVEDLLYLKEIIELEDIFGDHINSQDLQSRIDRLVESYTQVLENGSHIEVASEIEMMLGRKREWFINDYNEIIFEITTRESENPGDPEAKYLMTKDLAALVKLIDLESVLEPEYGEDLRNHIRDMIIEFTGVHWLWPVEGYYSISSGYGIRSLFNNYQMHSGIDIHGSDINGAPIRAAKSGMAYFYLVSRASGKCVIIDHGDGTFSLYGHASELEGENRFVRQGDIIAYVGSTGQSTGPHLHFEIREGTVSRDIMEEWLSYKAVPNNPMSTEAGHGRRFSGRHISYIYEIYG